MLLREIEMKPGPKACIDTMSVEDAGHALIAVQEKAVRAVNSAMPQLRQAAELAADTLFSGGRQLCRGYSARDARIAF